MLTTGGTLAIVGESYQAFPKSVLSDLPVEDQGVDRNPSPSVPDPMSKSARRRGAGEISWRGFCGVSLGACNALLGRRNGAAERRWEFGNGHVSRASLALSVPPIRACRGAKPLCVLLYPPIRQRRTSQAEWGTRGLIHNHTEEVQIWDRD